MVKRVYKRYQELLKQNNAVDFDDLLLWTAHLLSEFPAVREKYARRFQHVLVDEFQDTNFAQYILLKHLASAHDNIFVVGDPDQSVYRWRGADYRNVQRFEQDFPDAQVILLEQNYRSKQTILMPPWQSSTATRTAGARVSSRERGAGRESHLLRSARRLQRSRLRGGYHRQSGRRPDRSSRATAP